VPLDPVVSGEEMAESSEPELALDVSMTNQGDGERAADPDRQADARAGPTAVAGPPLAGARLALA
jgi:hypothetical protein